MPESWVSVDDVASHPGVAKDSVYRWIEQKGLPAHRVDAEVLLRLHAHFQEIARGQSDEDSR